MRWIWRWRWKVLVVVALLFLGGNYLAWRHACALFRFDKDAVDRTKSPEKMTIGEKLGVLANGVVLPKPQNTTDPSSIGLDYETVEFENPRGHRLEAWFLEKASAPIVALFHGYGASKEALLPMAAIFRELGYSCLLLDFYGSGGSSGHSTSFGFYEAEDVVASLDWVSVNQNARPTILYGISMGGAAVTRACSDLGAQPSAIIIESTFPNFRSTIERRFELMGVPSFPAVDVLLFWGRVELGFAPGSHNPSTYAQAIKSPALVFTGSRDTRVPLSEVREMANEFPSLGGFKAFDAGHRPFAETHPEQWKAAVKAFLDKTVNYGDLSAN